MTNLEQRRKTEKGMRTLLLKRLLATSALPGTAACLLMVACLLIAAQPALADGGAGAAGSSRGGAGGTDSATGTGENGGNTNFFNSGGGGGGAGAQGGTGGNGTGGTGGTGGAAAGANGSNGASVPNGGGGGGGGAHGGVVADFTSATGLAGGAGGSGGNSTGGNTDAGGGGAGGWGLVVTNSTNVGSLNVTTNGGQGGNGGSATSLQSAGGNGGSGGIGVAFTGSSVSGSINANVTGGAGGAGGDGNTTGPCCQAGNGGDGGGGISFQGSGGSITINDAVTGGAGGAGGNTSGFPAAAIGGTGGAGGAAFSGNGVTVTVQAAGNLQGGNGGAGGGGSGAVGTAGLGGAGIAGSNLTVINDGTIMGGLSGDGLTRTDAIVFAGGTNFLSGTGTIGSFTMISGSTFAPGPQNAPGWMTVSGNLTFQPGAFYSVHLGSTTASQANVSGTATLDGTVLASFSGSLVRKEYTILTSGGLSGAFLPTAVIPNFSASVFNVGNNVVLSLDAAALGASVGGLSQNQANVATAINSYFNNGGTLPANFVNLFNLTGTNLATALTSLSGEAATGAQYGAFQFGNQFLTLMLDPFAYGRTGFGGGAFGSGGALSLTAEPSVLPPEIALAYAKVLKAPPAPAYVLPDQRFSVWAGGFGGANRTQGDPTGVGSHDITTRSGGYAAGMDYRATPDTVVGFALAGGFTNWGLTNGIGSGSSDAFQAGLYGVTRYGAAYLAGAANFAEYWMKTDRTAFLGDHLQASFDAQSFGGRIEGGYRFATWLAGITPYAALQAQRYQAPGYNETDLTNGGFGLNYNGRDASDTRSELGARFDWRMPVSSIALLALHGRAAWAHDWVSDPTLTPVFQTLPGASFIVNGATPVPNSALASAGAELRFLNGWSLSARFDGEFADRSQTYAGTGTLRYTW